jgi:hypothetical protein
MRTMIVLTVWMLLWALSGYYYGRYGTQKDISWLLAIPYFLPGSIVIWLTIRGAFIAGTGRARKGAIFGAAYGLICGFIGYVIFMEIGGMSNGLAFRDVPRWLSIGFIWALAGLVSGLVVGLTSQVAERLVSVCAKIRLLPTVEDDPC